MWGLRHPLTAEVLGKNWGGHLGHLLMRFMWGFCTEPNAALSVKCTVLHPSTRVSCFPLSAHTSFCTSPLTTHPHGLKGLFVQTSSPLDCEWQDRWFGLFASSPLHPVGEERIPTPGLGEWLSTRHLTLGRWDPQLRMGHRGGHGRPRGATGGCAQGQSEPAGAAEAGVAVWS